MSWLREAEAEVAEQIRAGRCTPPTVKKNLLAMTALGECLDEIDKQRQREAASPAA